MMAAEGTFIHQFELGPWDNFIYFLGCKKTRECAVVDPAWHLDTILREAEKLDLRITHILCTHSHFDHVDQAGPLTEVTDAPVHMLAEEIDFSGFRSENLVRHHGGEHLVVGEHLDIEFLHTPGHTPGSTSYRVQDGLVTGDTLFVDGCGRCDFVGGDPEIMYRTLRSLVEKLPADTTMYPGHNYGVTATSRLEVQLETNPFLKLPTLEGFVAHRMEGKKPGTALPPKPDFDPEVSRE